MNKNNPENNQENIQKATKQKKYYEKNKEVILQNAKLDYKEKKQHGQKVLKVFVLKQNIDKLKELKKLNDLTYEELIVKFLDDNEKLSLLNEFIGTNNPIIREKWIKFLSKKGVNGVSW